MKKKVTLDTPWSPGDRDPGKNYQEHRIMKVEIDFERKAVVFESEYGNEVEGEWVKGDASKRNSECLIEADYDAVLAITCEEGDNCVENLEEYFLQLLKDRGLVSGTIS